MGEVAARERTKGWNWRRLMKEESKPGIKEGRYIRDTSSLWMNQVRLHVVQRVRLAKAGKFDHSE